MVALHDAVEHGIGRRLISYLLVPVFNGELACDDGGAAACAAIDDLQQVAARLAIHRCHAPIVQQQHIGVLQDLVHFV